jgi:hypothetical protein
MFAGIALQWIVTEFEPCTCQQEVKMNLSLETLARSIRPMVVAKVAIAVMVMLWVNATEMCHPAY